jgi:hypothetical protein
VAQFQDEADLFVFSRQHQIQAGQNPFLNYRRLASASVESIANLSNRLYWKIAYMPDAFGPQSAGNRDVIKRMDSSEIDKAFLGKAAFALVNQAKLRR